MAHRTRSPTGATRTTSPALPRRGSKGSAAITTAAGRSRWRDLNAHRDRSPGYRLRRSSVLVGKYRIEDSVVGKGACSVVKPAHDTGSGKEFVAKIIRKRDLRFVGPGDEVHREVVVLQHLPRNKHIVEFVELLSEPLEYYVILESVSNGDLCDAILDCPENKVPEERARRYFGMLTDALLCCHHHGVSHRDVKPENMLLNARDELKLSDFGLARIHRTRYRCQGGDMSCELVGTLRYAAPELFAAHFDKTPYDDFVADVWSLGVCLYVMLTGVFPFSSGPDMDEAGTRDLLMYSTPEKPTTCSPEALDLLEQLLQKNPKKRIELLAVRQQPWLEPYVRSLAPGEGPDVRVDPLRPLPGKSSRTAAEEGRQAIQKMGSTMAAQDELIESLEERVARLEAQVSGQQQRNAELKACVESMVPDSDDIAQLREEMTRLRQEEEMLLKSNASLENMLSGATPAQAGNASGRKVALASVPSRARQATTSPQPRRYQSGNSAGSGTRPSPAAPPKPRSLSPRPGGSKTPVRAQVRSSQSPIGSRVQMRVGGSATRTATPPRPATAGQRTTTPPRAARAHTPTRAPSAAQRRLSPASRIPPPPQHGSASKVGDNGRGRATVPASTSGTRTPSSSTGSVRRGGPYPQRPVRVGDTVEYKKDQDGGGVHVEGIVRYIGPVGTGNCVDMVGVEVTKSLGRTPPRTHDGKGCFTPERDGAAFFCMPSGCKVKEAHTTVKARRVADAPGSGSPPS